MNNRMKGALEMFVSSLFFALNIPAIKALFSHYFTPGSMLISRMTFGAVAFWILSLFRKQERMATRDFFILMASGAVGLFFMQFLYMVGLHETSPVDVSIILTIPPVLVLLLSAILYHERLTGRKIVGVLLAISGALLVVLMQRASGTAASLRGNLLVLIASVSWTIYLVLMSKVAQRYSPLILLRWLFLWAAIPAWIVFGGDIVHHGLIEEVLPTRMWLVFAFVMIFPTVIAYLLIPSAMKYLTASQVAMFNYVTPIIASVVAIIAGQASLRWDQPVAAVLIFVGVYLVSANKHTAPKS